MKVFWFDCETSGLDPERHGIISLACAVEIDGQVVHERTLYANCEGQEVEDSAMKVNHFTREQIAEHPSPQAMHGELADLFGQYVNKYDPADKFYPGGYNVDFDVRFLRALWDRCGDSYFGSWFYFGAIDPAALVPVMRYMDLLPDFPTKSKLTDLAEYLGSDIRMVGAHNAEFDISLTRFCVQKLIERLKGVQP